MTKRRIFNSGKEKGGDHRGDFETCPHCNKKRESKAWITDAHTLCLEPRFFKKGSVSVITECRECFKDSWVHVYMDSFRFYSDVPKKWIEAVKKAQDALKLQALRDWAVSLCGRCAGLKDATIDEGTYRGCHIGMGPAELESCKGFKPLKTGVKK